MHCECYNNSKKHHQLLSTPLSGVQTLDHPDKIYAPLSKTIFKQWSEGKIYEFYEIFWKKPKPHLILKALTNPILEELEERG